MSTNCTTPRDSEGALLDAFEIFRTNMIVSHVATLWLIDSILIIAFFPLFVLVTTYLNKRRGLVVKDDCDGLADMEMRVERVEPDLEQEKGGVVDLEKSMGRDSEETMVDLESQMGEKKI